MKGGGWGLVALSGPRMGLVALGRSQGWYWWPWVCAREVLVALGRVLR